VGQLSEAAAEKYLPTLGTDYFLTMDFNKNCICFSLVELPRDELSVVLVAKWLVMAEWHAAVVGQTTGRAYELRSEAFVAAVVEEAWRMVPPGKRCVAAVDAAVLGGFPGARGHHNWPVLGIAKRIGA
jgi:hypothetical protein